MVMQKMVDGELVDCTPDEEAAILADRAISLQALADHAADKRWRVMCDGITFSGINVPGDDDSQNRLKRAADGIAKGTVVEPVVFCLGLAKVSLTKAQIDGMVAALEARTQAAFTTQGDVIDAINAGTITTFEQINAADWPA